MRQGRLAIRRPRFGLKANAAFEELTICVDQADQRYGSIEQACRES